MRPGDIKLDWRALAIGGGLLLLVMFLPWFGTAPEENPFISPARKVTVTAWKGFGFIDLIIALTALSAIGIAVLVNRRGDAKATGAELAPVFGLALLSVALILYRLIDPIENTVPKWGAFLGILAAVGVAVASLEGGRYLRARFNEWKSDLNRLQGPGAGSGPGS